MTLHLQIQLRRRMPEPAACPLHHQLPRNKTPRMTPHRSQEICAAISSICMLSPFTVILIKMQNSVLKKKSCVIPLRAHVCAYDLF